MASWHLINYSCWPEDGSKITQGNHKKWPLCYIAGLFRLRKTAQRCRRFFFFIMINIILFIHHQSSVINTIILFFLIFFLISFLIIPMRQLRRQRPPKRMLRLLRRARNLRCSSFLGHSKPLVGKILMFQKWGKNGIWMYTVFDVVYLESVAFSDHW